METDSDSDSTKAETYSNIMNRQTQHTDKWWCLQMFFDITAVNNAGVVTRLQLFSISTSAQHPITANIIPHSFLSFIMNKSGDQSFGYQKQEKDVD